jgi:hypothetical protein
MKYRVLWAVLVCLAMAACVLPTFAQAGKPIDTANLREVASWQGDGIKNTEAFTITKQTWYVMWATTPGKHGDMNFQIYVYREGSGELVGVAANVIGESRDYSVFRGTGQYYLTINSGQPYTVVVMEPK